MKLSQLGEWGLIHRIQATHASSRSPGLILGLGDDAAVFRATPSKSLLLTTDLLVEDVDFDLVHSRYHQIGYKALAANLSDIAAMGGLPRYFLVSIAAPPWTSVSSVDQLYRGMRDLAKRFKVALIGGDTSSSRQGLFVNLVVVGEVEPSKLIRRGLRLVAARYYRGRRPPSTGLFVSVDNKLGDEAELFGDLERQERAARRGHLRPGARAAHRREAR